MTLSMSRRLVLAAVLLTAGIAPAIAQTNIRFAAVFSERDIRARMIEMLAKEVEKDFKIEPFYNGTLFKQGTELVALQRDNLELGNIAPQDISKQIPAWSILTAAYVFRDANHLAAFWNSDLGAQMKKMAEDEAKVKILGPTFFGTRQVGLKPKKKINTPADMAGIKLRMPPGDAWQLLGRSLGANPTPMAFAETYTGLQTGAVDGQDNPLPNVQAVKFYEVMSQIVLTSHLIGYDLLTVNLKTWNAMSPEKQKAFQAAVDKALKWSIAEHLKRETELADEFKKQGLEIYTPDVAAFRDLCDETLSRVGPGQGLAEGHAREDQRPEVRGRVTAGMPSIRRPAVATQGKDVNGLHAKGGGVSAQARRKCSRRHARHHVRRLHGADRFSLLLQFPDRLDHRADPDHLAVVVLWGAAFVVKESEEIRFDLVNSMVGARTRLIMAAVSGVSIVVLYLISLPATWSYVTFMKVEKSSYLKIPMNWLYSIYVVFVVAVIIRYLWLLWDLRRGKAPEEADITKTASGL